MQFWLKAACTAAYPVWPAGAVEAAVVFSAGGVVVAVGAVVSGVVVVVAPWSEPCWQPMAKSKTPNAASIADLFMSNQDRRKISRKCYEPDWCSEH